MWSLRAAIFGALWAGLIVGVALAPAVAAAQQHRPAGASNGSQASGRPDDAANPANPDSTEPGAEDVFSQKNRRRMYQQGRLSTTQAILRNALLPGLGNIYARQYFYAGIALSLMAFAAVFVSYGAVTHQPQFWWIGLGSAAVAYGGSIATSIAGVDRYNRRLRQGLKLGRAHAGPWSMPRARSVGLRWRF